MASEPNKPSDASADESFQQDRQRLARDFDPYLQDSFSIYRTNPRRQEAYDRCAPDVVKFLKCVDAEGPTWFWRCNTLHIELQRCYEANKPATPPLLQTYARDFKDTALTRWQQAKDLFHDLTGGRGQ
ncbi:hypothetical protein HYH03_018018 [Edaphochlamys debaryana]|uniref:COX assembly mitochondrial protein n=1 Tax=Edaphochlamys debaryana TaxID=47281 RepID=A0A835XEJ9_9CHLO|nr:hypothetical protein HYH03_018018 [Edaphochlamys debaryana]|eukprot:KAG2483077.1 hypothetical protein HYH03_018018 [Edaphochlamys debaryana]